ncbi:MAG TPA: arsenate reductase (glutaredoxin) [Woeseiaceae bacterium]|nr:arsenate reductase (glutaredoxin) [Woeseiaceae bacterium]
MPLTLYHNPRCSKSRATLELIRAAGLSPRIVAYLDDPPDAKRIQALARMLGMPVAGLLRRGEAAYREARDRPDEADDAALADWLARHPRVIERPIVVDESRRLAVIGRPPENVRALLP